MFVMNIKITPFAVIKSRLDKMNQADIQSLADRSEVPFTTLLKIKGGQTPDPRFSTVARFAMHLGKPSKAKAAA